ncbi:anaerobic ribonucleoside-triphosphate reductase activating protein [candidate division WS5 bacterium]|uniref:Anaerobic ribonucleoside-triphosphate reductase activating protein n=1 Tax=candidate division WS5 bacterium TaxID=2093353 RepID=A0A419DE89_9BACT|nr:MAG: anaerobic ribonucleoside-triphosphate reductase activating protein [candidate division WS5 bacterium]
MKIAGLVKNSLIDYPGKITAIVFTQGCNFRCPYCHNPDLVDLKHKNPLIPESEVFGFLNKRKGLLEAVTITGGEPTLQKDLLKFISKVKNLGYFVKLDTNGTNPDVLIKAIDKNLVDYIAMDIKHSLGGYALVTGYYELKSIKKSIETIMGSGVEYEFRTTVLPRLHKKEDFEKIGEEIRGANKYFIQNFRPDSTLNKNYQKETGFTLSELKDIKKAMEKYVKNCSIRENI